MFYIKELCPRDQGYKIFDVYLQSRELDGESIHALNGSWMSEIKNETHISLLYEFLRTSPYVDMAGSKFFLKVETEVIPFIADKLISELVLLHHHGVMLVLDINIPISYYSNTQELYKYLYLLSDYGYEFCFSAYDWKRCYQDQFIINKGVFKYVRVGPPSLSYIEFNAYLDVCFMMKEEYGINIILDFIKSRDELNLAYSIPFFALGVNY